MGGLHKYLYIIQSFNHIFMQIFVQLSSKPENGLRRFLNWITKDALKKTASPFDSPNVRPYISYLVLLVTSLDPH